MINRTLALALLAALSCTALPAPVVYAQAPAPATEITAADREFLFRLNLMEGHLSIAHELIQAKKARMAVPHFGHPVRELYDDMAPYLKAHKFPPFKRELVGLEAAATATPYSADTEAKYQAVMQVIAKAKALTPEALRASVPDTLKICSDVVTTAAGEYNGAIERGKVANTVEYHDSRGFIFQTAQQVAALKAAHPDAADQALLTRFQEVLAKAEAIVQPLLPESKPRATVAQYRAIAAEAATVATP